MITNNNKAPLAGVVLLAALGVTGCATTPTMYYWGDYSKSLYAYKKDPGEETWLAQKKSLDDIIATSKAKNLRVPPGVYAELGYFYLKSGDAGKAIQYFDLESEAYPESQVLMGRLIAAAEKRQSSGVGEASSVERETN